MRIDVERFGMTTKSVEPGAALLGEQGGTGPSAALLVDGAADLERACQAHAGAADGFGRKDPGRDARLHVARAAPVDLPVAYEAPERIHRPPRPDRDDVEVPVT
jgi:hypothetical protein